MTNVIAVLLVLWLLGVLAGWLGSDLNSGLWTGKGK